MGGFSIFHVLFVLLIGGALVNMFTGGWQTRRIVLRGYRIGFDPIGDEEPINGYHFSAAVRDLLAGDPKFIAIIGRPAGPINFLREFLGFPRRVEFAISKQQAVLRTGSFTSQSLILSKMKGLDSIGIARGKPNPLVLLMVWMAVNVFISAANEASSGYGDGSSAGSVILGLITLAGFVAYYFFNQVVTIRLQYGKDSVQQLTIHPPFWERLSGGGGVDMSLEEANRIAQVFRVLKDN